MAVVVGSRWGPGVAYSGNRVVVGARYGACCCSTSTSADQAKKNYCTLLGVVGLTQTMGVAVQEKAVQLDMQTEVAGYGVEITPSEGGVGLQVQGAGL